MNAQGHFCDEHPNGQCLCPDKGFVKQDTSKLYTKSDIRAAIERRIDDLPDTLAVVDYQRIRDIVNYL